MITALAGGIGASKLLLGLALAAPDEEMTIVVNTGDDIELLGLYIAPDLDTVTYTLAGAVNPATGWGLRDDTFHCLETLERYGLERWFNLGDRDLATHLFRTQMLGAGRTLSEVADEIRRAHGVRSRILPMSNAHTPTTILTDEGELHFQEYLVKRRAAPVVRGIRFERIAEARPAPGVTEAIREAEAVILCPSNPLISLGPILSVPGVRAVLRETAAPIAAISPIVGGASLKGPTDRMLADLGYEVSAAQVARLYDDFIDLFIIDHVDEPSRAQIARHIPRVEVTGTVMTDEASKLALARFVLDQVRN
jgi:LPPG:FO 2-phospho-L-lactate transferase